MRDKKCCRLPYQSRLLAAREAQQATSIVAAMFSRHMLPHEIQTCDTKPKSLVPVLFQRSANIGLVPSCFSEADSWNVNPAAASWPLLLNAQLSNTSLHHPKRASMQAINCHQIVSCHQGGGNLVCMQPCFVLKNPTSHSVLGWLQVRAGEMVGNSAPCSAWREQLSTGIAFTTALQCPTFSGLKEGWKRKVTKVSHSKPLKDRILSLIPPFFSNLYQSVHHTPLIPPRFQQGELRPEASASKGDCSLA